MNHQTPAQVDPIELRKKLRRMGIGAKFQFSQTAAMDAVTEAMGSGDPEIEAHDGVADGVTVQGDMEATCPHCGKVFEIQDVEIEGDADIDASYVEDHVSISGGSLPRPTRLEAHELAYMVNAWSLLWEVPE
jgi:hypothetical protein